MSIRRAFIKASLALALTSVPFLATSASAQAPDNPPGDSDAVKTEDSEVRERLREMEEQQKTLLEQIDRLQRQLGPAETASAGTSVQPAPAVDKPSAVEYLPSPSRSALTSSRRRRPDECAIHR